MCMSGGGQKRDSVPTPPVQQGGAQSMGPTSGAGDARPDYGNRVDGTKKGQGWLGPLPTADGRVMTEQTAEMDVNGERIAFPLIHPGSTKEEIDMMAKGGRLPRESVKRALDHALERKKQGLSPYKD